MSPSWSVRRIDNERVSLRLNDATYDLPVEVAAMIGRALVERAKKPQDNAPANDQR